MDSSSWDPRFRPHRLGSRPLASDFVMGSSRELESFATDVCRCQVCTADPSEDVQDFAIELCPCQVCRARTDNNPGNPPTNLSNAA